MLVIMSLCDWRPRAEKTRQQGGHQNLLHCDMHLFLLIYYHSIKAGAAVQGCVS